MSIVQTFLFGLQQLFGLLMIGALMLFIYVGIPLIGIFLVLT